MSLSFKSFSSHRQDGFSVLLLIALMASFALLVGVSMYFLLEFLATGTDRFNETRPGTPVVESVRDDAAVTADLDLRPDRTDAGAVVTSPQQQSDDVLYPATDPYELTQLSDAALADVSEEGIEATQSDATMDDGQPDSIVVNTEGEVLRDQADLSDRVVANEQSEPVIQPDQFVEALQQEASAGSEANEESDSSSESTSPTETTGDLSIAGKVTDQKDGRGVSGISVRMTRLGSAAGSVATATLSDANGQFRYGGLAPGDYSLTTVEAVGYSPATTIVKAGVSSAELRVASRKQILITGLITGEDGSPVANARIQTPAGDGIVSTANGQYRLTMVAEPDRSYSLRYNAPGHREETRHVHASTADATSTVKVDVRMVRAGGVSANGVILSNTGQPVSGATVWLTSPGLNIRGQAMSDDQGQFLVPGLKPAKDYRIIVNRAGFTRYQKNNLELDTQSLPLAIELNVLPVGNITGLITDVDRTPVPDFTINVVSVDSNGQSLTVSSDANGYFQADGIPSGEIRFQTRSEPSMSLTGLDLPEGERVEANLIVDWGTHSISGIVQTKKGEPYANARLIARWNTTSDGLISDSTRIAKTDLEGNFNFSELGPGVHEIIVESDGTYLQKSVPVDPRSDANAITIEVEPIR